MAPAEAANSLPTLVPPTAPSAVSPRPSPSFFLSIAPAPRGSAPELQSSSRTVTASTPQRSTRHNAAARKTHRPEQTWRFSLLCIRQDFVSVSTMHGCLPKRAPCARASEYVFKNVIPTLRNLSLGSEHKGKLPLRRAALLFEQNPLKQPQERRVPQ